MQLPHLTSVALLLSSIAVPLALAKPEPQLPVPVLSAPTPKVSIPSIAAGAVSSAKLLSSIGANALPTSIPIPSLGVDEASLILGLSQLLQVLQLMIGLVTSLNKGGSVKIPGIGNVGLAVEKPLLTQLLVLAQNLIPKVST